LLFDSCEDGRDGRQVVARCPSLRSPFEIHFIERGEASHIDNRTALKARNQHGERGHRTSGPMMWSPRPVFPPELNFVSQEINAINQSRFVRLG
jgi:hypothetical protein